ncbi:helix-turn-helix domain-containing protein [Actinomadura bangladeshensis]|uniref:helix-turn-helix domain-containing protein n=1 Tax=Actinomadura bangladeshensis TaxID=453573 RepID=UPI003B8A837D
MSQTDVADKTRVAKSRISQIERGQVPTVDTIARYVQALGGPGRGRRRVRRQPANPAQAPTPRPLDPSITSTGTTAGRVGPHIDTACNLHAKMHAWESFRSGTSPMRPSGR